MKQINIKDAIGQALCHDIVRIVIGTVKERAFKRGHVIREEDIEELLALGKEHVFVMEPGDENLLHEEDVAYALYDLAAGDYMHNTLVNQGKVEAIADIDGMLQVDVERLRAINSIGQLTIVTKLNHRAVKKGELIAGMRCIPLLLDKREVEAAQAIAKNQPILQVKPFVIKTVGIVTTGTEVYTGRIADAFTPIIEKRMAPYGMKKVAHIIVPDDTNEIVKAIETMKTAGVDIIFCTGGMSVDPDDLTPGAISRSAETVVTYGLPVLPGSMVCIAYTSSGMPIVGLPGGVLFSEPSAFDVLLPRLAANDRITKEDCIAMGHGGLL